MSYAADLMQKTPEQYIKKSICHEQINKNHNI